MPLHRIHKIVTIKFIAPPSDSKKVVFKLRSVSNIVIAAASTGKDNSNKNAVINIAQQYKGKVSKDIPLHRIHKIVTIKFIAPPIEEKPAKCKLKIAASTAGPECAQTLANGG
jgi:hypothetical protein